jgi:uncharacterized membrane protein
MHSWLLDTRARDALNTHDLRVQGGHPALAHETIMGRREDQRKQQQTTKWYVHAYLHADDPAALPLGEDSLEGLQFGGKRNYGYGEVQLKDTQMVDLEELDYSRLEGAGTYLIELVTPFVVETEYPDAADTTTNATLIDGPPGAKDVPQRVESTDPDGIDFGWVMQTTFVLTVTVGAVVVTLAAILTGVTLPDWGARASFAIRVGAIVWIVTAIFVYVWEYRRASERVSDQADSRSDEDGEGNHSET